MMWGKTYNVVRYYLVPPIFLFFFTIVPSYLVSLANPSRPFDPFNFGNKFSWTAVGLFAAWAYLWIKHSPVHHHGPKSPAGYIPKYAANGTEYYSVSLVTFFILEIISPILPTAIYDNTAEIIGTLNVIAWIICIFLIVKGHLWPEVYEGAVDKPLMYQFYAGIELHPRLLGVDVKQFTNCRFGMLGWAILSISYCHAASERHGDNVGTILATTLLVIYLFKFFYWETGYFNTLDITLDRAGFYLCWGCLTWVQVFYTFSFHHLVAYPCKLPDLVSILFFIIGCFALVMNYWTDQQKEFFKETNGTAKIFWLCYPSYIPVKYLDENKKVVESRLLISGFWGIARHLNYLWEMIVAFCWCIPAAWGNGPAPLLYFFFLVILLVHRTYRDDDKCAKKYGTGWARYCEIVPYRIIPGVF